MALGCSVSGSVSYDKHSRGRSLVITMATCTIWPPSHQHSIHVYIGEGRKGGRSGGGREGGRSGGEGENREGLTGQ